MTIPTLLVNELLLRLNNVNRLDMMTSIEIAGIANCVTRDASGNLLPLVWIRQSVYNEYDNATLLTREALQKHLQTFLEAGVKDNVEILQTVDNPGVFVDWVVRIAEHWEQRYALKRNEKYDISQTVFSAMLELVNTKQIWPLLLQLGLEQVQQRLRQKVKQLLIAPESNRYYKQLRQYVADHSNTQESQTAELESRFWLHAGTHAIIRLLFRSDCVPELRERLCILTGKLLQKKEVCNKAGAYSSQRQRNDVVEEYCRASENFKQWLICLPPGSLANLLNDNPENHEWIFLIVDHTALPVTLSHMKTPPLNPEAAAGSDSVTMLPRKRREKEISQEWMNGSVGSFL